ncbi:serine/threonine-protein kinase Nek2-like, partial [Macadamia integrifolia]|uniref:serine/threonine-protein kinase Nek2-like n=1 Tax=Macadamia integrifolia TaxID=60698 RepID=UPI001C4FF021
WTESNCVKKTRFSEPEDVHLVKDRENKYSFSNERILNPNVSGSEQESLCSTERVQEFPSYLNEMLGELSAGSTHEEIDVYKPKTVKTSNVAKTPRMTPAKASATKRRTEAPTTTQIRPSRESLPASRTPANKSVQQIRRASLPFLARASPVESPCRSNANLLGQMNSPDVSVNAPRIDKMVEFPLASSEDPFFHIRRTLSPSAHGSSSTSPHCGDRSLTKDKCTVQIQDIPLARASFSDAWHGIRYKTYQLGVEGGSECSDRNPTAGASGWTSPDYLQRRFDTSSYQQRAEALEGLLEFSAQLLHQERFEELGVLLKPFGPGKVSSRETAIWLTKSFKETTMRQED